MITVADIMTKQAFWFEPDTLVQEAAEALSEHRYGGAPVVENDVVVGVLSKSDIMDHLVARGPARSVREVMTPLVFYVRPGDPGMTAVRLMLEEGVHRVVVVNEHGHLEGLVTPMDVLRALARGAAIWGGDGP